jgi:serine/threonine-protein kinase
LPLVGSASHGARRRGSAAGVARKVDSVDSTEHPVQDSESSEVMAMASAVGVATESLRSSRSATQESAAGANGTMPGRRRLRISVIKALIVALVVALVAAGLALAAVQTKFFTPSHRLPNIVDLTVRQASVKLRADHLHLQAARRRSSVTVRVGRIIREIPAAGTSLKEGSDVSVVVSSGPPPVAVPSLTGLTGGCAAVTAALGASHLRPDCTYEHSTQVNDGGVIDWNPKTRAPEFSTVTVLISQGPPIVTYPSLSGITTCDGVTSAFTAAGLTASCSVQYSPTVPSGGVVSETPPNQAPEGSTVTVVLSKGPAPVAVPPIPADHKLTDEINALQNVGLVAGNVWGPASGRVFQTNPSPGQMVLPGTSVNIYTQ